MKIGLFLEKYRPHRNGLINSVELFQKKLESLGHKVYIFTSYEPDYLDSPSVFRFRSFRYSPFSDFRLIFPYSRKIWQAFLNLNLDIVHTHNPFFIGRLGLRWAKKTGIPAVHTYHTFFEQYLHYPPGWLLTENTVARLSKRHCDQFDMLITPSLAMKRILHRYNIRTRIEIVPNGIDLKEFKDGNKKIYKDAGGIHQGKVLLFVGRLAKEKNIPFLLECFQEILSRGDPGMRFLIVGDGPERNNLVKISRKMGIFNCINFCGWCSSRKQLIEYYTSADVFVSSSLSEAQGLTVLEALASGTPVVALKAMGISEMIENGLNGFLVESKSEFAEKVTFLLRDGGLRNKMAHEAKKSAQKFSSKKFTSKILSLYEEVRNGKKNSGAKERLSIGRRECGG